MNELKKHKHYDRIVAWAEGKDIEYFDDTINEWAYCCYRPIWCLTDKYRIKPQKKVIRFRSFLYTFNKKIITIGLITDENTVVDNFIKWIGDWQEVEVDE